MPAPSPSWNLVRVRMIWRGQTGALKDGTYKVTLPLVTNTTDQSRIPAGVFDSGPLQTAVGSAPSLDVMVPSNDDPDILERNWKVNIEITFPDVAAEKYSIDVPYANRPVADGGNGLGVNLINYVPATSLPQNVAMFKIGVPGGLAVLNDAGNVIDGNGNVIAGGGAVASVAGRTGAITLTTADIGGLPTALAGKAPTSHNHAVTDLTTTGTASSTTFLRGDGTWATPVAGASDWSTLAGKPATFAPTIGTTATTAKAGNYQPTAANISDSTTAGRALITAADAAAQRTSLGLGSAATFATSDLPVSTPQQAALDDLEATFPSALSQLTGTITTAQVAPRTVMRVLWTGTAWPSSPAGGRTDISIDWVDEVGTSTAPPIVAGRGDVWLKAV